MDGYLIDFNHLFAQKFQFNTDAPRRVPLGITGLPNFADVMIVS
jgi:hypothetical protein